MSLCFYSSCQRKAISSVILCAKARCNLHRLQKHTFRNIAILVVEFGNKKISKLIERKILYFLRGNIAEPTKNEPILKNNLFNN